MRMQNAWFAVAAVIAAAGCAESGDSGRTAPVPVVTVHAHNYRFDAPDTIPAGWTWLRMVNETGTLHHVQVYRLPEGRTAREVAPALPDREPMPSWLEAVGGPEGAGDPRVPVEVAVLFEPGEYMLACRFETDGVLHLKKGMVHPLTVVASAGDTSVTRWSEVRDTIWLQDFSFTLTEPIEAGMREFVVVNRGPHEHHVAVARLRAGMGLREILASYSDPDTPESYDVVGGTAGIGPGGINVARVLLEPGRYVLVCFMVDPASGMDHVQLSMVRIFEVT